MGLNIQELKTIEMTSRAHLQRLCCRLRHVATSAENLQASGYLTNGTGIFDGIKNGEKFQLVASWLQRGLNTSAYVSEDGAGEEREITNPKVLELADRIIELNMLEVSDLTEVLRKRLNIQGGGMPMGFAMPAAMGAAPGAAPSGDAAPVAEEKTDFTVKLSGFDATSKIKVIKEVRAITDLGLKEAKELVEGAPAVIKEGLSKEDAEELKSKLESAGAQISLE